MQLLYYTFCEKHQIDNFPSYSGGSKDRPANSLPYSHPNTDTKTLSGTNLGSIHPEAKHYAARYDPHNWSLQNNFIEANYIGLESLKKANNRS